MYVVEEARYRDTGRGGGGDRPAPRRKKRRLRADFAQVLDYLNAQSYYRPLDKAALWYGAAAGLAKAAGDQYTTFSRPEAKSLFEQDLEGQV